MSKRDGSSPNENRAPIAIMSRKEEGKSSVPVKKPRLEAPEELFNQESSSSIGSTDRVDVAGRVASVRLQNFMCHANLQIDFKTHQNNCFYIGGPNGSGKSALFAAINLGLGGRGSDNDRGSTVKSYIKDGTAQAKISISLTNVGLNAHPDFDELIAIERTINQTSSTYVMKSVKVSSHGHETERIVSKKKCDIDRIISRFNIHLSNPAFWMSQDRSRSFLANFKPTNVYKLYLESTNLENIRQSYMRFADLVNECGNMVQEKYDELSLETKKLKRMQEQRILQEKLAADKQRLSVYEWKFMFCPIRDYDDQIQINQKKQELQKKLHEESKVEFAKNRTDRGLVDKSIQDLGDDAEILKEDMDEAKRILAEKQDEVHGLQENARKLADQIKVEYGNIKAVETSIEKHQQKMKQALSKGKGTSHLAERLAATEKQLEETVAELEPMEVSGELDKLKDKAEELHQERKAKDDEKYYTITTIKKLRNQINDNQEKVLSAKAMKQNVVNKYGRSMADIINEIGRRRSQFDGMPKGPLGKFITVNDPKWSCAVEECISKLANHFLCTSQKDSRILQSIFDYLKISPIDQPSIIVSAFSGKCYQNLKEPVSDYQSVYRALTISDPDVNNVVIDKSNCEQILLIENNSDAMKLMGSNNPPQNARKAYTLDGSQAYANTNRSQYRFYRGRGIQAVGLFNSTEMKIDEAAINNLIKEKTDEISHLQSKELVRQEQEIKEIHLQHHNVENAIKKFETKIAELRRKQLHLGRALEDLKREISNAESTEANVGTINDLIEELKKRIPEIVEKRDVLQGKLEDVKAQITVAVAEETEALKNKEDMRGEVKEFDIKLRKLHEKLGKFDEAGDILHNRIDKLKKDESVLYHEEARLKSERDEAQQTLDRVKAKTDVPAGEQDPPDLSNFPTSAEAQKILFDLQKKVARAADGCDQGITNESVKEFKEMLLLSKYRCRMLNDVIDNLRAIHETRMTAYPSLRQYTDMKVCDKFRELLEVRGHFIGGLEFDHERQTLHVNVKSCKLKDAMAEGEIEDEVVDEADVDEADNSNDEYPQSESDDGSPRRKKAKKRDSKKKKKETRDLKGLSGGERSFVTASLVMSLWEVMEQPFRMMDEFDVFMDMMNRKLVMDLLVELATKKFPHNQFIFFTPQGIKELKKVDGLQVFEMNKVRD